MPFLIRPPEETPTCEEEENRKENLFELEGSRAWEYVSALIRADRQIEQFRRELPRLIEIDIPIAEKEGMSLEAFYASVDICAELAKPALRDARENKEKGRSNKSDQLYWEDAILEYLMDQAKEDIKKYDAIYDKKWRSRYVL